ncbi:MAG: hypothetical protein QE487_02620 [Fluviicola sp.]|nr:hypothetical protein [Fluviicola sp.]
MKHSFHLLSLIVVLFSKQQCLSQDNTQVWIDERRISLYFDDSTCWTYFSSINGRFLIKEDKLFVESEVDYENNIDYSQKFIPGKDDLAFQICKKTDSSLVLHPLNIQAIQASFEMTFEYMDTYRLDWYKKYLDELTAAKKKKQREKVIQKWREEHDFYVDTLRFRLWPSLYEEVRIDSLCYSTMSYDFYRPDSITYHDFKLSGDGRFFTSWSRAFAPEANRVKLILMQDEIQFIAPPITDMPYDELELPLEETLELDPAIEGYLDESIGIYKGKVSIEGMNYVNEKVSEIGISTLAGDSMEKNIDYLDEYRARLRIYYNGTYKDFVMKNGMGVEFLLQELVNGLDILYEEFTEFEPHSGAPIVFPTSYTTTPFTTR